MILKQKLPLKVAILIPTLNEAESIKKVINKLHVINPDFVIYVYDNGSTDNTHKIAHNEGAIVIRDDIRGKSRAIQRMFSEIDADLYVTVDGDGQHDLQVLNQMIETLLENNLSMVIASRKSITKKHSRAGHASGNRLIRFAINKLFNGKMKDPLSGYRVMSRPFVKSFPLKSVGFQVETDLTIHALELGLPLIEIESNYFERQGNSKLNTFKDGFSILTFILKCLFDTRPLQLLGSSGLLLISYSLVKFLPIYQEFLITSQVKQFPTLIVISSLSISGVLLIISGIILKYLSRMRIENKRLAYLKI